MTLETHGRQSPIVISPHMVGYSFFSNVTNADDINNNLPTFYRELLQYFQEFKNKTKILSHGNFLLWKKEAITIEKRCYFGNLGLIKKKYFLFTIS